MNGQYYLYFLLEHDLQCNRSPQKNRIHLQTLSWIIAEDYCRLLTVIPLMQAWWHKEQQLHLLQVRVLSQGRERQMLCTDNLNLHRPNCIPTLKYPRVLAFEWHILFVFLLLLYWFDKVKCSHKMASPIGA